MMHFLAHDEHRRVKGVGTTEDEALTSSVNPLNLALAVLECTKELHDAVKNGTFRKWQFHRPWEMAWMSRSKNSGGLGW